MTNEAAEKQSNCNYKNVATSPTTSKLPSPAISQASCSQDTESTISLTSRSQDIEITDKCEDEINIQSASVECQTDDGILDVNTCDCEYCT